MDRHIRRPHDPPPFIPGTNVRFEWPDADDPCVKMIRERVQEGAPGLFVLCTPGSRIKVLAECYYPDEMRDATWTMLDPPRKADWQDGRLVCVTTIPVRGSFNLGGGRRGSFHAIREVTLPMVEELRRNNRAANSNLKRSSTASNRKQALEDAENERFEEASQEFADFYTNAYLDTEKFAMGKPRVSMYSPRSDT